MLTLTYQIYHSNEQKLNLTLTKIQVSRTTTITKKTAVKRLPLIQTLSGMTKNVIRGKPSSARPQPLRRETLTVPTVAMPQIHLECVSNEERSGVSFLSGTNLANEDPSLIKGVTNPLQFGINGIHLGFGSVGFARAPTEVVASSIFFHLTNI